MSTKAPSVVYVLPDKMGGVGTIVANLLAYRKNDAFRYHAVLTDNWLSTDTRLGESLNVDEQVTVEYRLPVENLHAVLRRIAHALPAGPGVLVSNDWIELAMLSLHDTGRTVIQILHGDDDYYYDLALKHERVIHAFVTYGRVMYDKLRDYLPHRRGEIFYLPYGIPIASRVRASSRGRLRLLFAGRLENGQKGIFDLPAIDRHLRDLGILAQWTLVGSGPDREELRERWENSDRVRWLGRCSNAEVLGLYADHDVFVLPTRSEGVPVALVEAMGAGLVPVVSDIASGVAEIVKPGVNGYRPAVGDPLGFAVAIAELEQDREKLEAMSRAGRQLVLERFDMRERVAEYQALFARWRELYRPRPRKMPLHFGSRLDQAWLPNALVYTFRAAYRQMAGKAR